MYVLIATAARPELLTRTLDSLASCALPDTFREVIVVENGGRRGVEEAVANASPSLRARYMFREEPGKCGALNAGLATLDPGLVVFLDDDVRLAPETLTAYTQAAAAQPRAYYGGPCAVDYETPPPSYLIKYLPFSARGWEPEGTYGADRPMHFLGFNWAAHAEDVRAAGGFPEHVGPGQVVRVGDEDFVQDALLQRGLAWEYVPAARVWHWVPRERSDARWLIERGYHNGRSRASLTPSGGVGVFGCPWWVWRRWVTSQLRSAATRLVGSEQGRFRAAYGLSINRGLLHGYREKAFATPATPNNPSIARPVS